MTKLEILQQYSLRRIRDSWAALGGLEVLSTSRIYNKEQMYRVHVAGSALDGALLYCKEEYIGNDLPWAAAVIHDSHYGEISFGNKIVDPHFALLATAEELATITEAIDPTFIPFQAEFQSTADVQISDEEIRLILAEIGVPFISFDELEYSRQDIVNLMIKPALQEYFKWFPKVEIVTYPISTTSEAEHEFPTGAYDVLHVAVNQGLAQGSTTNILLRYFDEVVWSTNSPYTGHMGGRNTPHTRTSDWGAMMLDRAARQGMINYATRIHHRVISKNGKKYLACYTNKLGHLQVHYAMRSNDWSEISFARLPEARRLASAYALTSFGMLRSQAKSDIPGTVDYSKWVERGDALREKVISEWQEIVRYSGVIRGSM